jgi:ABC-2 type transport system ATP-binding protein
MVWGVDGLRVDLGRRRALDGVTLDVPNGTVTGVIGGDGAGKTTLLRVLAGAAVPTAGIVRRPPPERVGYMSAGPGVYLDLSVTENLTFVATAYGMSDDRLDERLEPLLARTGLGDARGRLGGQLSGGMRQKLALAMALLPEPDLLVLDEATTGVDPVSRMELWRLIAGAAAAGAAVVFSTTYVDEAERAAHVLVLHEGRPLVAGTPDQVIAATPGTVLTCSTRPDGLEAWRRGSTWRAWSPDAHVPPGAARAEISLEDALIVAELAAGRVGTSAVGMTAEEVRA